VKGVYVLTALVGLGFSTWIGIIIVRGVQGRIKRINNERRKNNW
jgi:hypothetical protein